MRKQCGRIWGSARGTVFEYVCQSDLYYRDAAVRYLYQLGIRYIFCGLRRRTRDHCAVQRQASLSYAEGYHRGAGCLFYGLAQYH